MLIGALGCSLGFCLYGILESQADTSSEKLEIYLTLTMVAWFVNGVFSGLLQVSMFAFIARWKHGLNAGVSLILGCQFIGYYYFGYVIEHLFSTKEMIAYYFWIFGGVFFILTLVGYCLFLSDSVLKQEAELMTGYFNIYKRTFLAIFCLTFS
jgi:hypothetical protein